MELLIAGLTVIAVAIATIVLMLAVFRTGTRRQEQTGSLSFAAPGRAARLTRRVTGLYAETPPPALHPYTLNRAPRAITSRKEARTQWL